jgi:hypothetical protein
MTQLSEEDKELLVKEAELAGERMLREARQQAGWELAWMIPTIVVILIVMGWLVSL